MKSLYTKIKDSWYFGPSGWQFPDCLYHLHTKRSAGLSLHLEPVWNLAGMSVDTDGRPISTHAGDIDTQGTPIYGCNCGAIAPDYVVNKLDSSIDRKAAVEHTKNIHEGDGDEHGRCDAET